MKPQKFTTEYTETKNYIFLKLCELKKGFAFNFRAERLKDAIKD